MHALAAQSCQKQRRKVLSVLLQTSVCAHSIQSCCFDVQSCIGKKRFWAGFGLNSDLRSSLIFLLWLLTSHGHCTLCPLTPLPFHPLCPLPFAPLCPLPPMPFSPLLHLLFDPLCPWPLVPIAPCALCPFTYWFLQSIFTICLFNGRCVDPQLEPALDGHVMDCAPVVQSHGLCTCCTQVNGCVPVVQSPWECNCPAICTVVRQYVQLYDLSQVTPSLCCMFAFLLCAVCVCVYSVGIYSVCIDSLCMYSVCICSLCYLRHVCL